MTRLVLSFLGCYDVRVNEAKATGFRSDKSRALLAYLAVESDRPHLRARLAGLLWPDYAESYALSYLRQALANLRDVLQDRGAANPILLVSPDALQFNMAGDSWLDVTELRESANAAAVPLSDFAADRLERGVALYRGPFLEGFQLEDNDLFEEWQTQTREHLHLLVHDALIRLIEHHFTGGHAPQALAYARRLVELGPEDEEARRRLMRLLALAGQRSEAIAQYTQLREVLGRELGVQPDAETVALADQIQHGGLHPSPGAQDVPTTRASGPRHSLPAQPNALVGRDAELAQLADLLTDRDRRLVTLVGVGGIGKTRLALAAAAQRINDYADGVWFVALAGVSSPDLLATTIMEALGVSRHGETPPEEQLLSYACDKEMLLVLDNFEHLMAGASLVARLLECEAGLQVLVTSRERLRLAAEWVYQVEGLELPPEGEQPRRDFAVSEEDIAEVAAPSAALAPGALAPCDAVKLFVRSAQRSDPHFRLSADNATAVERICRQVEGMPLGIELAAGWTRVLPCKTIASRLASNMDALQAQTRDAPPRQQSLQIVFEHSWRLLAPQERRVLAQLGVFRGGFDLEAAQAVADAGLSEIGSLLDKSWLRRAQDRYEMHELVRQFALGKLEAGAEDLPPDPARQAASRRHSAYYGDLLRRLYPDLLTGRQFEAAATILRDIDNVQAGWRWSVQNDAAELIDSYLDALGWMIDYRGWYAEMQRAFGDAVLSLRTALADPALTGAADQRALRRTLLRVLYQRVRADLRFQVPPKSMTTHWSEFFEYWQGEGAGLFTETEEAHGRLAHAEHIWWDKGTQGQKETLQLSAEALRHFEDHNDSHGIELAEAFIGDVLGQESRFRESLEALYASLAAAERAGEQLFALGVRLSLALTLIEMGELASARDIADQVVASARAIGSPRDLLFGQWASGECSFQLGEYGRARREFGEALDLAERLGQPHLRIMSEYGLAEILAATGHHEEAKSRLAEMLHWGRNSGLFVVNVALARLECAVGNCAEAARLLLVVLPLSELPLSEQICDIVPAHKMLVAAATLLDEAGRREPALILATYLDALPEVGYRTRREAQEILRRRAAEDSGSDVSVASTDVRQLSLDDCIALARRELAAIA